MKLLFTPCIVARPVQKYILNIIMTLQADDYVAV